MQNPFELLMSVVVLVIIGAYVLLLAKLILAPLHRSLRDWWRRRTALATDRKREAARQARPVKLVGAPDLQSLKKLVTLLDKFIAVANSHRPKFIPVYDTKFRVIRFSFPFDFFFPRQRADSDDGPDPAPWEMATDSLLIPAGQEMRAIYKSLDSISDFPCMEPTITFDPPPPPSLWALPVISCPPTKIVFSDGSQVDTRVEALRAIYAPEIANADAFDRQANAVCKEFATKQKVATEAVEMISIHLANQMLLYKDTAKLISEEFRRRKRAYEHESETQTRFIKDAYQDYKAHTKLGIENHFNLALRTLPLPLPEGYPWKAFYDSAERILQVNQRVPFLSDIVVKRPDSKRIPAKRDSENFLRRIVPSISLHIAQHVGINDMLGDIDTIAVNCWCRYFERSTGKLRNAFVSSLKVEKNQIAELNLSRADALDAFRALRGVFIFAVDEVAPIEPQVRLDKTDDRFVEGKDVLEGMAQGQNLATMDWQDFEHLIRELLSKEYASREGAEVRITRASRDRGVDAVIFDPNPLHGGKYVVQAKRYNNLVDVSAVRDLWGTVMNEGAARGILVTTSRYGRDAYDFASNKPLILIDGQNLLSLLAKHGYQFKIELL